MAHLLLVDDDLEVLEVLSRMLCFVGHSVVATHDGKEACDLIGKEDFELVITDLVMPDINGWDIAGKVKDKATDTPVILITGHAGDYEDQDLSSRGVDLLLAKPVTLNELGRGVEDLIESGLKATCQLDHCTIQKESLPPLDQKRPEAGSV